MKTMYGSTGVAADDLRDWAAHDHSKSWNDGGAVQQILGVAARDLEKLVADESKAAVADYANAAEMALGVSPEGHLLVGVRLWNDDAAIIVKVPFMQLVLNAIQDVRGNIATDAQAQALLSAIVSSGQKLASIGRPSQPAAPARGTHQQHAVRSQAPQRPARTAPSVVG